MKEVMKKLSDVLKTVFGYGVALALFVGGFTFFGYVAALIVGGDLAAIICEVMYKKIIPVVIYLSTSMVLLGLISMYLAGEMALTPDKKKAAKTEGEK